MTAGQLRGLTAPTIACTQVFFRLPDGSEVPFLGHDLYQQRGTTPDGREIMVGDPILTIRLGDPIPQLALAADD